MRHCTTCNAPLHPGTQICLSCRAPVQFVVSVRQPWVSYAWLGSAMIMLLLLSGIVSVLIG